MKKVILSLMALVGTCAVYAAPDVALPGFQKRMKVQQRSENQLSHPMAPPARLMAAPPQAVTLAAPAAVEMETVDRLIKVEENLAGQTMTGTFEYDEYGFPKRIVGDTGFSCVYEYLWHIPGKVWSSKKMLFYESSDDSFPRVETDERTFHPNGSVATRIVTVVDVLGQETVEEYEYDDKGNLLRHAEMRTYTDWDDRLTTVKDVYTYTYFALLDKWIEGRETQDYKEIVALDGDNGYTITRLVLFENVWKPESEQGYWFGKDGNQTGSLDVYYNIFDGTANGWGSRNAVEEDANGRTETQYELVQGDNGLLVVDGKVQWMPRYRYVYSANYDLPYVYNPGETRTEEQYDYEDGKWKLRSGYVYTWVNSSVVKCVYDDYEDNEKEISYYMVAADLTLTDDIYYDEATGSYGINTWDDVYDYYTYYKADGSVIYKFRRKFRDAEVETPSWEEWRDNAWQKCKGTITVYEDSDDMYVITFDSQSRIIAREDYENGVLDSRTEYTYNDKGYVEKEYYMNEDTGKLYLAYETSYATEGDQLTVTTYDYDRDGNVEYANKRVSDSAAKITRYYSYENNTWVLSSTYAEPAVETLADGTVVTIEREVDNNGNIVNRRKRVELNSPTYELSETYEWSDGLGKWIGVYKSERRLIADAFRVIEPTNPVDFEDEYFFPNNYMSEESSQSGNWFEAYWQWDYAENTGWICFNPIPEYVYPDEYTRVLMSDGSVVETVKVDSQRRKIEVSSVNYDYGEPRDYKHTWAYDDKGRLTNDTEYRVDGDIWVYNYTYGPIEVISGVDDIAAGTSQSLTVYNLQGMCVLRDAIPEAVKALPQGIYIANGKKIVVK